MKELYLVNVGVQKDSNAPVDFNGCFDSQGVFETVERAKAYAKQFVSMVAGNEEIEKIKTGFENEGFFRYRSKVMKPTDFQFSCAVIVPCELNSSVC